MAEKQIVNNKNWTSSLLEGKEKVKITGTLTSQIQLRGEGTKDSYYYAFVKLKGQSIDLPVIFKSKNDQVNSNKPALKKDDKVELAGHYSNSPHSIRKSFTCWDYLVHKPKERNIFAHV